MTKTEGTTLEYLTKNDWVLLGDHAVPVEIELGITVIRQGQPIENLYVIREGKVSVQIGGKTVATLGVGAICGEMGFLEGRPASASVVAESDPLVADKLSAAKLRELFETFPTLGLRFYKSVALNLSRRLRDTSSALAVESKKENGNGHRR
jgi:CRP/FNR family cyclic AMP-dependent transcriptional regulator